MNMATTQTARRTLVDLAVGLEGLSKEFGELALALDTYAPPLAEKTREVVRQCLGSAGRIREGAYGPTDGHLYDMLLNLPPRERRIWALHRLVNWTPTEIAMTHEAASGVKLSEEQVMEIVGQVDERLGI
jgi:DNA-directed RNA polymerase specialized sigma24 family protein